MTYVPPRLISDRQLRHQIILDQLKACPVVGDPVRAWHVTITFHDRIEETWEGAFVVTAALTTTNTFSGEYHLVVMDPQTKAWRLIQQDSVEKIEPFVDMDEVERIKTKLAG